MNEFYLDEDIIITLPIVKADYVRLNVFNIYKDNELIFTGTTYISKNAESVDINVTDIMSSYKPNYTFKDEGIIKLKDTFTIVLDDSLSGNSEQTFEVVYIYRYPNKDFDYSLNGPIVLGGLVPRYPKVDTDNFKLQIMTVDVDSYSTAPLFDEDVYIPDYTNAVLTNIPLTSLNEEGVDKLIYKGFTEYVLYCNSINVDTQTLDTLIDAGIPEDNARKVILEGKGVLIQDGDRDYIEFGILPNLQSIQMDTEILSVKIGGNPLAYLEACPAKYYLKWIDRKGGIQCQPFRFKNVYSEEFANQFIRNAAGYRRKVYWDITQQWTINSEWLDDELYPIYESIFTSPYLQLYDTELDKTFDVLLTDNAYTEKTYKNQKQMFNMTLNLVASKNQNIYN